MVLEALKRSAEVYPACAGIDPYKEAMLSHNIGLPRMRGDRPEPESRM